MRRGSEGVGVIVIAAGGTGGHIYPAVAVAREIVGLAPGSSVHFCGSARGPEARIIPREGFAFTPVASGPWRRARPLSLVRGVALAARGAMESRKLLREVKAGVVFSTGGYASAPVLLAAASLRLPAVLHEPNRVPGLVNRVFGRVAAGVAAAFEETAGAFPAARVRVTGVPVRRRILERDRDAARRALGLSGSACVTLVLGGSQGASAMNRAVADALPRLSSSVAGTALIWLCGRGDFAACERAVRGSTAKVLLFDYLDDIDDALAAADLVVARGGGSTGAELLALGKPSVLVPYPHATGNHQARNAAALEREGAAVVLMESDLTGATLADTVVRLAADPFRRAELGRRAAAQGRPGAARAVAEMVLAAMRSGG